MISGSRTRAGGSRRLLAVLAVVAVGALAATSSALADVTGTGGGAYVAFASLTGNFSTGQDNLAVGVFVPPVSSVAAPAPPIATSPTTNSATLVALSQGVSDLADAGLLVSGGATSSSTSGALNSLNLGPGGSVTSSATVAGVFARTPLRDGFAFSATGVGSTCTATHSALTGSTTIVGGQAATGTGGTLAMVDASPAPNTPLAINYTNLAGVTVTGTIVLNEQTITQVAPANGGGIGTNTITVNAVRIAETVTIPALIDPITGIVLIPAQTETLGVILGQSSCTVTGPDVNANVAVTFRSLSARVGKSGVAVRWSTASEIDLAGFNVYRQVDGKRVRVNKRIIASASRSGHRYSFVDRSFKGSRAVGAKYFLQAINLDGSRSWYGPARVVSSRAAA